MIDGTGPKNVEKLGIEPKTFSTIEYATGDDGALRKKHHTSRPHPQRVEAKSATA